MSHQQTICSFIKCLFTHRLGIVKAVNMAEEHIKANGTILPDIELVVIDNNDGCHLDSVMRTFINYYVRPDGVLGVLGKGQITQF